MKRIFLISLIVNISISGHSQAVRQITMDEAIALAWENSFDAYSNNYSYELSRLNWMDQKYGYRPTISLGSTISDYTRSIQEQWDSEEQKMLPYEVQWLVNSASLNLYQPVPFTGGSVSVYSGLRRNQNFAETGNVLNYVSTPVRFSYSQDFSKPNSFKWNRKIGELRFLEANSQRLENREQVAIRAITAFYDLLIAQNQLEIASLNASNADSLMWMAQQKKEIFAITRSDFLNLELQQTNAKIQLEKAQNDLEMQQVSFNIFLGLEMETTIECITQTVTMPIVIINELALSKSFENNSDILAISRKLQEAERSVLEARRQSYSLSISGSLGLNQNKGNIVDAYSDLLDQQGVGLTLSVPIYDGGRNARSLQRSKMALEYQQKEAEQNKIELSQQITQQVTNFNITGNQLKAYAKSDTLGAIVYQAVKERFILGKASIIDMINAEERRQNARLSYLQQLKSYWIQYYGIRKLCLYDFEQGLDLMIGY